MYIIWFLSQSGGMILLRSDWVLLTNEVQVIQTNFLDIQNSYELTNVNQYKKSIMIYYNFISPE